MLSSAWRPSTHKASTAIPFGELNRTGHTMLSRPISARALSATLAASATLLLMLATEPRLAPVWDEGFTLIRLPRVRAWFEAMRDPAGYSLHWRPELVGPPLEDSIRPPFSAEINSPNWLHRYLD
jgi:hypothetical protein